MRQCFDTCWIHQCLAHQSLLSFTSLQEWTLDAARTDLISQNKEGIVSFPGLYQIFPLPLWLERCWSPPSNDKCRLSSDSPTRPRIRFIHSPSRSLLLFDSSPIDPFKCTVRSEEEIRREAFVESMERETWEIGKLVGKLCHSLVGSLLLIDQFYWLPSL